jgi:hypothetical protein
MIIDLIIHIRHLSIERQQLLSPKYFSILTENCQCSVCSAFQNRYYLQPILIQNALYYENNSSPLSIGLALNPTPPELIL